jgi:hypothetical protein
MALEENGKYRPHLIGRILTAGVCRKSDSENSEILGVPNSDFRKIAYSDRNKHLEFFFLSLNFGKIKLLSKCTNFQKFQKAQLTIIFLHDLFLIFDFQEKIDLFLLNKRHFIKYRKLGNSDSDIP